MTRERLLRIIAGSFIIASVFLFNKTSNDNMVFGQVNFLWFTLFVGLNLFQSGFTKWCLMDDLLKKIGIKSECD